jgi:hypothetical protein
MDTRAITLLRRCSLALALAISVITAAPQGWGQQSAKAAPLHVELVIRGPETIGNGAVPFTATLINRSKVPVTFVPPKPDWYEEYSTIWTVSDPNGRELSHEPKMLIWCDGLAFHAQNIPEPGLFVSQKPKLIQEGDLVTLQPGEKLEFCKLGDPVQFFRIKRPGGYKVALQFKFDPSHYMLPNGSSKAAALKTAVPLDLASNTLTVMLITPELSL